MNINIATALFFIAAMMIFALTLVVVLAISYRKDDIASQGIKALEKTMGSFTRVMDKAINNDDNN